MPDPAGPLRVLHVEDDSDDAELARVQLDSPQGAIDLTRVSRLSDALARSGESFDAILLDLTLPDASGLETLRRARAGFARSAIVVLTGAPADFEEAASGAQEFVVKGEASSRMLRKLVRHAVDRVRAEEELRRSQERYRVLFEASPSAVLLFSPETGLIEDANAAAQRQYGYTRDELIGRTCADLSADPDAAARTLKAINEAADTSVFQRPHRRKDGSVFPAEIYATVLTLGGRRLGVASIRDVSERERERKRLADSESLLREMAEAISQVFWVTDPGKNQMLYVSAAYEKIWGRTVASLMARPTSWLESIVPEDRPRVLAAALKQAEGEYDELYRILRPDGTIRWISDRAFPVKDAAGRVVRVVGSAQDVTKQRIAEEALLESKAYLERAQEVASIGSWSYDPSTGRSNWSRNCRRILGLEDGEETAERFYALVHPEDLPRVREGVERAVSTGGSCDVECRITRPDGAPRWTRSRAEMIKGPDGRPTRLIGIIKDVTEAREAQARVREAEERLLQAQKMDAVGRLAGGVAHDFNNILTTVLGLAELSLKALPESDTVRADVEEIRQAGLRAAGLTQQLLAFSRRQIVSPRLIELDLTVQGLAKLLRRVIGEHIELAVECRSPGAVINADPVQVEQLLVNLAVNARDAMPDGGRLAVATRVERITGAEAEAEGIEPGSWIRLTVADTGCGMEPEVLRHIYEPFFTTKPAGKGTGLGLATVYAIVKQSGGAISCRTAPGRGAEFRILLPVQDKPADAPPHLASDPSPRGEELVVVVEDEPAVRRLIERVLTGLGYRVALCADGEEGLRRLREDAEGRIRLLVTDMVMPKMGGRKLASAAAALRPGLKVLFTSGYTDDISGVQSAVDMGTDFLRKPFTPRELADRVRQALDRPA